MYLKSYLEIYSNIISHKLSYCLFNRQTLIVYLCLYLNVTL